MKTKSLILILLLACGGTLFADRLVADPKEAVRYVDVQRVIENWTALQAQSAKLQADTKGGQEAWTADYDNFKAAKADLDILNPESDEYIEKSFALGLLEKTLEERAKFLRAKYSQRNAQLLDDGVRRIHQACAELGEREGFSAILMAPNPLPSREVSLSDSVLDLQGRWVIWSNNSFDVSQQVLDILNKSDN